MGLPEFYRSWIHHGRARLVHPREGDVRRIIAARVAESERPPGLMLLVLPVRAAYAEPGKPSPIVRQGWGPLVARIARQMGAL